MIAGLLLIIILYLFLGWWSLVFIIPAVAIYFIQEIIKSLAWILDKVCGLHFVEEYLAATEGKKDKPLPKPEKPRYRGGAVSFRKN